MYGYRSLKAPNGEFLSLGRILLQVISAVIRSVAAIPRYTTGSVVENRSRALVYSCSANRLKGSHRDARHTDSHGGVGWLIRNPPTAAKSSFMLSSVAWGKPE